MARFEGTVRRSDLEGGVVQLETAAGDVYELDGGAVDASWVGKAVVIEGAVDEQTLSFSMTGPRLTVKTIRAA